MQETDRVCIKTEVVILPPASAVFLPTVTVTAVAAIMILPAGRTTHTISRYLQYLINPSMCACTDAFQIYRHAGLLYVHAENVLRNIYILVHLVIVAVEI